MRTHLKEYATAALLVVALAGTLLIVAALGG